MCGNLDAPAAVFWNVGVANPQNIPLLTWVRWWQKFDDVYNRFNKSLQWTDRKTGILIRLTRDKLASVYFQGRTSRQQGMNVHRVVGKTVVKLHQYYYC